MSAFATEIEPRAQARKVKISRGFFDAAIQKTASSVASAAKKRLVPDLLKSDAELERERREQYERTIRRQIRRAVARAYWRAFKYGGPVFMALGAGLTLWLIHRAGG